MGYYSPKEIVEQVNGIAKAKAETNWAILLWVAFWH